MMKRSAFTLVELSVTMSAGSALMILAIGLLHQSMSLVSIARERSDQQRTLQRLAQQFRQDVHRAATCAVTGPKNVQLVMPDETTITYVAEAHRVARQQRLGGQLARSEAFPLSADAIATFESLETPTRAMLTVASVLPVGDQPVGDQARVDRSVSAVVGRLIQHQQGEVSP